MNNTNAPEEMRRWFHVQETDWRARRIEAQLRLPDRPDLNKAVCTFETATHVGSLTAWGAGTVEFIVLDLRTNSEVISRDVEYVTAEELRTLLNECAAEFERIAGES
jgi:hypothetical protein